LLQAAALDGEAHQHMDGACAWYRRVNKGENAFNPEHHCQPVAGKRGQPAELTIREDGVDWVVLTPRTPAASTVHKPTVPPGGPGLFHIKGRQLPPYVQHVWHHLAPKYGKHRAYGMAVGIVKKWAAGINPGGKHPTKTHADVRAAAGKNVAEWEKDKADARSHGGKVKATLALAGSPLSQQYGLWQNPSMQLSPSPHIAGITLPTAQEIRAVAGRVPDSADKSLSNHAKLFLTTAAGKMEKDDRQEALSSLRSAQTALAAAHRADIPLPVAYTAPVPPAQSGSVAPALLQARDKAQEWRKLEVETAKFIDRLRRQFFHGQINSQVAQGRL
jgi:hypothetical protein